MGGRFDIPISGFSTLFIFVSLRSAHLDFDARKTVVGLTAVCASSESRPPVLGFGSASRVLCFFFQLFFFFSLFFLRRGNLHSRKSKESAAVKWQKSLHANSAGQLLAELQRRVLCITARMDSCFAHSGE